MAETASEYGLVLSDFDLDMLRQWFNTVQDTAPRYLEQRDFELAARIHQSLRLSVPKSVSRHLDLATQPSSRRRLVVAAVPFIRFEVDD